MSRPTEPDQHLDLTRTHEAVVVDKKEQARPYVQLLHGTQAGQLYRLRDTPLVAGRDLDCDIVLDDPAVSRTHARLIALAGTDRRCRVEDMGSRNGTHVDGQRILRDAEVFEGARIRLGTTVILKLVHLTDEEAEQFKGLYMSSVRDHLTGICNRRHFLERFQTEWCFAVRHKVFLSIAILDLDHFKQINDTYGHAAGDQVLSEFALRIEGSIRVEDLLARYGGEEFVLLLRQTSAKEARLVSERMRATIADHPFELDGGKSVRVTMSVGVATLDRFEEAPPPARLLELADRQLYRAKEGGRNRVYASSLAG